MLELNIASSDIALQLISLLEARVDAWNLQATDRHTDPWNRLCSLGHFTVGVYPRHPKLCRRPTYAPQVSHDPWSSPDFRLPTPSSSSTPATSPACTNCRSLANRCSQIESPHWNKVGQRRPVEVIVVIPTHRRNHGDHNSRDTQA